jgi:hypothetical protein
MAGCSGNRCKSINKLNARNLVLMNVKVFGINTPLRMVRFLYKIFESTHFKLGHMVAHLVEALSYTPEGSGFYSRWGRRNFSLT